MYRYVYELNIQVACGVAAYRHYIGAPLDNLPGNSETSQGGVRMSRAKACCGASHHAGQRGSQIETLRPIRPV
jgi:hypothetical protein